MKKQLLYKHNFWVVLRQFLINLSEVFFPYFLPGQQLRPVATSDDGLVLRAIFSKPSFETMQADPFEIPYRKIFLN